MNSTAVLSLIGDLYVQIEGLQKEKEDLLMAEGAKSEAQKDMPFDPLAGPEEADALARKESEE